MYGIAIIPWDYTHTLYGISTVLKLTICNLRLACCIRHSIQVRCDCLVDWTHPFSQRFAHNGSLERENVGAAVSSEVVLNKTKTAAKPYWAKRGFGRSHIKRSENFGEAILSENRPSVKSYWAQRRFRRSRIWAQRKPRLSHYERRETCGESVFSFAKTSVKPYWAQRRFRRSRIERSENLGEAIMSTEKPATNPYWALRKHRWSRIEHSERQLWRRTIDLNLRRAKWELHSANVWRAK